MIFRLAQELNKRQKTVQEKKSQFLSPGSKTLNEGLSFKFFIFDCTKNLPPANSFKSFSLYHNSHKNTKFLAILPVFHKSTNFLSFPISANADRVLN